MSDWRPLPAFFKIEIIFFSMRSISIRLSMVYNNIIMFVMSCGILGEQPSMGWSLCKSRQLLSNFRYGTQKVKLTLMHAFSMQRLEIFPRKNYYQLHYLISLSKLSVINLKLTSYNENGLLWCNNYYADPTSKAGHSLPKIVLWCKRKE